MDTTRRTRSTRTTKCTACVNCAMGDRHWTRVAGAWSTIGTYMLRIANLQAGKAA